MKQPTPRRVPRALTDDRSDDGINAFARAIWPSNAGPGEPLADQPDLAVAAEGQIPGWQLPGPIGSRWIRLPQGGYASLPRPVRLSRSFPQHSNRINSAQTSITSFTQANKLSGKFFFTNQPSIDPLAKGNALTSTNVTKQLSSGLFLLTDVHVFSPAVINEFRVGFFRNRNNSEAMAYHTNAEFGIQNPVASEVPDLSQINIARREWRNMRWAIRSASALSPTARVSSMSRTRSPMQTRCR